MSLGLVSCPPHRWGPKPVDPDDRATCDGCGTKKLLEADFRAQIVGKRKGRDQHDGIADQLGWEHVGFRPAQTVHGYRTPGTGTMAEGWPDLTLVHPRTGRLLFVELKGHGGELRPDQRRVLAVLAAVALHNPLVEVHVWGPDDLEFATEVLSR